MVVVPLLYEALPSEILVFPLVMVDEPRDVVLLPREMEELPMASLVFPLLMVVLPSVKAVFPSVKLVFPIVFLTRTRRWGSGLTPHRAWHSHAARLGVGRNMTRMLSMDGATPGWHKASVELVYVGFGRPHTTHASREWTEAAVGGRSLSGGTRTVGRLSLGHDDTARLKETLLKNRTVRGDITFFSAIVPLQLLIVRCPLCAQL